jgi:hypothetical protein
MTRYIHPFPFLLSLPPLSSPLSTLFIPSFSSHCKEVYSLNEQEIDYVWNEYKKGVTTLMDKKELTYE